MTDLRAEDGLAPDEPEMDEGPRISYRVFFERTFDPIALYRVSARACDNGGSTDQIRFWDVNPAYERVMKVKRADVIGRSFAEVWPNVEPCWSQLIINCLCRGRTSHCEGTSSAVNSYLEAIAFSLPHRMVAVIFMDRTKWKLSQDALCQKQEELRRLAMELTLSEEETRRSIATDLHDRVGYSLVSLLQKLRKLQELELPPDTRAVIDGSVREAEQLIAESRSLIFELSPPILKEVGLNPALEALADNLLTPNDISWSVHNRGTNVDFPADDDVCVILYRMTRELLINVIKHANATHVIIRIFRGPGKIQVVVEDDGKGFPLNFRIEENRSKGFGLFSIYERLLPLGGDLRIISDPDKGAIISMVTPLHLEDVKRGVQK